MVVEPLKLTPVLVTALLNLLIPHTYLSRSVTTDHCPSVNSYQLPHDRAKYLAPQSRHQYKMKQYGIDNPDFQADITRKMKLWTDHMA